MGRYARIDKRWNNDQKVKRLSFPPNARGLWFYLICSDLTNQIGAYKFVPEALAVELGWPFKALRDAFREVLQEGMIEYDEQSLLLFIPTYLKHNPPVSPNAVKSWKNVFDELPECTMKAEIFQHLKAFLDTFKDAFRDAFKDAFPEDYRYTDTDTDTVTDLPPKPPKKPRNENQATNAFDLFWEAWPKHDRKRNKALALKAWKKAQKENGRDISVYALAVLPYWIKSPEWTKENGRYIQMPSSWLNAGNWALLPGGEEAILDKNGNVTNPKAAQLTGTRDGLTYDTSRARGGRIE